MKFYKVYLLLIISALNTPVLSQEGKGDLKIFGYFQNTLRQIYDEEDDQHSNSFSLQQLNVFFQKDIATNWRAFISIEFLNNFSSGRQWGAANLEEAWLRYRLSEKFNLKFGLLLPVFNNLNDIKNRTPLLPYITRPIVYETSFSEFFNVEQFTPGRAFVQAYGFLPFGNSAKFDYAVYLGNSPNINDNPEKGQTGIDTTSTFLAGGRIGLRYGDLKIGFSASRDNDNQLVPARDVFDLGGDTSRFQEVPRLRLGNDVQFHYDRFSLEGETIFYRLANESEVDIERFFYYLTLGYQHNEQLFAYVSYWYALEKFQLFENDVEKLTFKIPTVGLAYYLNDRIRLKAQYAVAIVHGDLNPPIAPSIDAKNNIHLFGIAASVFF